MVNSTFDASLIPDSIKSQVERFRNYTSPLAEFSISSYPADFPARKLAAVLILVYERAGKLRVLLTTRSKELRSHPGQVALPGGKSEEEDGSPWITARREANEEVGLPLESSHIQPLCTLPPFISLFKIVVTPVVALLTDPSVLADLKPHPSEVDDIFDHPLEAFLDPEIVRDEGNLSEKGGEKWPYEVELHSTSDTEWMRGSQYRMHRFRSTSTPIKGLTSDMLIMAAEIAFDKKPLYDRYAPGQISFDEAIKWAIEDLQRADDKDVKDVSKTAVLTSREMEP